MSKAAEPVAFFGHFGLRISPRGCSAARCCGRHRSLQMAEAEVMKNERCAASNCGRSHTHTEGLIEFPFCSRITSKVHLTEEGCCARDQVEVVSEAGNIRILGCSCFCTSVFNHAAHFSAATKLCTGQKKPFSCALSCRGMFVRWSIGVDLHSSTNRQTPTASNARTFRALLEPSGVSW